MVDDKINARTNDKEWNFLTWWNFLMNNTTAPLTATKQNISEWLF